jgi:hypothetical protein
MIDTIAQDRLSVFVSNGILSKIFKIAVTTTP